jgi:hypothetical protein
VRLRSFCKEGDARLYIVKWVKQASDVKTLLQQGYKLEYMTYFVSSPETVTYKMKKQVQ